MSDLVERLKFCHVVGTASLTNEAAAEIEHLNQIRLDYIEANGQLEDEIERLHERIKELEAENKSLMEICKTISKADYDNDQMQRIKELEAENKSLMEICKTISKADYDNDQIVKMLADMDTQEQNDE